MARLKPRPFKAVHFIQLISDSAHQQAAEKV
jgi:hypothetical protein